jgi:negative regulator of flagellin synthesis FlgM
VKDNAVKINDTLKNNAGIPAAATPAPNAKSSDAAAATAAASNPAAGDTVRLSQQGKALAAGSTNQVFDSKKVERIKAAIADGQFHVNSEKVADGLLETVRDLLHSRKR